MKSDKFLDIIGELPEEMVAEAGTRRRHPLVRIAAVAACVAVLLVSMSPFLKSMFPHGGDGEIVDREVIFCQGAIYDVIGTDYSTAMKQLDLPETITDDLIGEKVDVAPDYGDVYSYAPLAGRNGTGPAALYLLERSDQGHEGEWWYLVFSGFTEIGGQNDYVEANTLMKLYGISAADHILNITNAETGEPFLEPVEFYQSLTASSACGREEFEELTFGDMVGEERLAADKALQEDAISLRLETDIGLVAYMTYYPSIHYICWSENCFYIGDLSA